MNRLYDALAIVISDVMEPDDINRIVESDLFEFAEEFRRHEIGDKEKDAVIEIFMNAQSRNGSRGWVDNESKYAPASEGAPRVEFDESSNVIGPRH